MAWISVNKAMPESAKRVYGWSATKGAVIVKSVKSTTGGKIFIDDNTLPVRDIIGWQNIVAPNETDVL